MILKHLYAGALLATVLVVAAGTGSAPAATLSVGLRDVATIDDGSGESRVLFRAAPFSLPSNAVISRATLTFSTTASPTRERIGLQVHPVAAVWDPATVDWSTAWSRPGGDYEEDFFGLSSVTLDRAGTASIDVTSVLKQVLEEGMFADGFILTVPGYGTRGLPSETVSRLNVSGGSLSIAYRRVGQRTRTIVEPGTPVRETDRAISPERR